MAEISMRRSHALEEQDVRQRIESLADRLAGRLGGSWRWQGDRAVCEARGAKATVVYDARSISLDVSLPLVLRPLRGRLEAKVEEYFERYFEEG